MTNLQKKRDTTNVTLRLMTLLISMGVCVYDYLIQRFYKLMDKKLPGRCVVLYYHEVTLEQRNRFAQQMDYIIEWAKPVSADLKEPLEDGICNVAITFDDGFACIIDNAVPFLIEREIPFTIFIPSAYLGKKPDWIEVRWIEEQEIKDHEVVMSKDQLRKLLNNELISIGSHCVTHQNLLQLTEEDAKEEILQSKLTLETLLNEKIATLSFPHGAFNEKHVEFAKQAGYERVFSISPGPAFSQTDEYVTERINADISDWPMEFRLKIMGAYRWRSLAFALQRKFFSDK